MSASLSLSSVVVKYVEIQEQCLKLNTENDAMLTEKFGGWNMKRLNSDKTELKLKKNILVGLKLEDEYNKAMETAGKASKDADAAYKKLAKQNVKTKDRIYQRMDRHFKSLKLKITEIILAKVQFDVQEVDEEDEEQDEVVVTVTVPLPAPVPVVQKSPAKRKRTADVTPLSMLTSEKRVIEPVVKWTPQFVCKPKCSSSQCRRNSQTNADAWQDPRKFFAAVEDETEYIENGVVDQVRGLAGDVCSLLQDESFCAEPMPEQSCEFINSKTGDPMLLLVVNMRLSKLKPMYLAAAPTAGLLGGEEK